MNKKIQDISQKVKDAVLGYPMVLAMAVTMASTIVFMIEKDWELKEDFLPMRIVITAALGISVMFELKRLSKSI